MEAPNKMQWQPVEKEIISRLTSDDWVCGWLICKRGTNRGRSYKIRPGKNAIGSDYTMLIRILGDQNTDKCSHGIIVYDVKSKKTTLLPGDSKRLLYLKDVAIFNPTVLVSHSEIKIGDSDYTFVPLCGERFDWVWSDERGNLDATPVGQAQAVPSSSKGDISDSALARYNAEQMGVRTIQLCPNNHWFDITENNGVCHACGEKLDIFSLKTQDEIKEELTLDPKDYVCGWLVCTNGFNKGRDYAIRAGKNAIGSDEEMPICVQGDPLINKRSHGVVVYDEATHTTIMLPGDSQGLVYKEKNVILKEAPLVSYDKIWIGDSEFIFVEFCTDKLNWDKE